jgi:hypothetical protein
MIGKVIGAFLGGKAAQHVRGIEGPTGAALGVIAPALIRRLSWPAMIALGVGGYLAKKLVDQQETAAGPRPAQPAK